MSAGGHCFSERHLPSLVCTANTGSDTVAVQDNTGPVVQPDAYNLGEDQTFTVYGLEFRIWGLAPLVLGALWALATSNSR